MENPLRSQAWHFASQQQSEFYSRGQAIRLDGCTRDFRNLQGELTLKSFRIRTSGPDAVDSWQCLCNHSLPHRPLEGGNNLSHSAKYTPQVCSFLARHIMKRPTNLVSSFGEMVFQDKSRTRSFLSDPTPMCLPCSDHDDELMLPAQGSVYDPPGDEEEDETLRNRMISTAIWAIHPTSCYSKFYEKPKHRQRRLQWQAT